MYHKGQQMTHLRGRKLELKPLSPIIFTLLSLIYKTQTIITVVSVLGNIIIAMQVGKIAEGQRKQGGRKRKNFS